MKSDRISRSALALSVGLLALMVSGPFLLPFHGAPIPTFWSEWWAAALGLTASASALIVARDRPLPLPQTLAIPMALLLALLIQFAHGRLAFPQLGLLYAAYLLWAGLLLILGRHLAETLGLARLADVLACALLCGALVSAAIALAQWRGATTWWMFPRLYGHIYGNLGQINHYVHYSWLGIASGLYLRGRGWLPRPFLWLLILPILFGSVVGGSRSVFLYAFLMLALAVWARRGKPDRPAASLINDAMLLLPVVVGIQLIDTWVLPYMTNIFLGFGQVSPIDPDVATKAGVRVYEAVSGPSVRLAVARAAWSAFLEHPWLGQGAGNYHWASFIAAAGQSGDGGFLVAENAHNFILQGMAEFGAPTTGVVILFLVFWAIGFFRQPWKLEHFWVGSVLGIGAIHALLEYPLWYAYFLGPTALLLGAADSAKAVSLVGRRISFYLALVVLGGISILASLRADYAALEKVYSDPLSRNFDYERAWPLAFDRLKTLHKESLLSPWAMLTLVQLAEPSSQQSRDRAVLCERGIHLSPERFLVTRCAMQLAIAGRAEEAEKLTRAAIRAYPLDRKATADELAKGARAYPEILPLWHLSQ